jgi:hypothetical protein
MPPEDAWPGPADDPAPEDPLALGPPAGVAPLAGGAAAVCECDVLWLWQHRRCGPRGKRVVSWWTAVGDDPAEEATAGTAVSIALPPSTTQQPMRTITR